MPHERWRRDREVERAVAHGRDAAAGRAAAALAGRVCGGSLRRGRGAPRDHRVGAIVRAGTPSTAVTPKRESTSGETITGSGAPPRARAARGRVDQRDRLGLARAALPAAGAQLLELLAHRRVRRPRVDLGVLAARSARSAPAPSASAWGVKTVELAAPSGPRRSSSTPSTRPSTSAARRARPRPRSRSRRARPGACRSPPGRR